jgi:hypothetical protein
MIITKSIIKGRGFTLIARLFKVTKCFDYLDQWMILNIFCLLFFLIVIYYILINRLCLFRTVITFRRLWWTTWIWRIIWVIWVIWTVITCEFLCRRGSFPPIVLWLAILGDLCCNYRFYSVLRMFVINTSHLIY